MPSSMAKLPELAGNSSAFMVAMVVAVVVSSAAIGASSSLLLDGHLQMPAELPALAVCLGGSASLVVVAVARYGERFAR